MNLVTVILSFFMLFSPRESAPTRAYRVYLPMVGATRYIGAQDETTGEYKKYYAKDQITKITLRWDLIEGKQGEYRWNVEGNDAKIKSLSKDYRLLIGTRAAPKWARKYSGYPCSQPKPEYYQDYGKFVKAVIERYHPWGVELWNEPDVERGAFGRDWFLMGCWDTGKQYAEMTRTVYPMVKADNLTVMVGALMLEDKSWAASFLTNDPAGDWVSFHAYPYNGVVDNYDIPGERAKWLHARTDKGVFLSEISLLDYTGKCSKAFEKAKADYLTMLNDNLVSWGIEGFTWYTIGGNNWRCSDLYPGPAYEAYLGLFGEVK